MLKIPPMGIRLAQILAGLFLLELCLMGVRNAAARRYPLLAPPQRIGQWTAKNAPRPVADVQRNYPAQVSVQYSNGNSGDDTVFVTFAVVENIDCVRHPTKYLADSDGRSNQLETGTLTHDNKNAFTISRVHGMQTDVIAVHWYQTPGGDPMPGASDLPSDTLKAILARKPFYVCDAWIQYHPTIFKNQVQAELQQFADTLAESLKHTGS